MPLSSEIVTKKTAVVSRFGKTETGDFYGEIKLIPNPGRIKTIEYAVRSYGFLINRCESLEPEEFALRIRKNYDCESNPQNAAVVDALGYLL